MQLEERPEPLKIASRSKEEMRFQLIERELEEVKLEQRNLTMLVAS